MVKPRQDFAVGFGGNPPEVSNGSEQYSGCRTALARRTDAKLRWRARIPGWAARDFRWTGFPRPLSTAMAGQCRAGGL